VKEEDPEIENYKHTIKML